jgi:hypothetical protein
MNKPQSVTILMFLATMFGLSLRAQDVVLPGSTPQGDILRGQGHFLKGMAWYELNAARARELDIKTARELASPPFEDVYIRACADQVTLNQRRM